MATEPIYMFDGLKNLLRSKGYRVDKAQAYRQIEIRTVNLGTSGHGVEITSKGIFVIDPVDGVKRQAFLYMPEYFLDQYGPPRYHICNCSTLQQYGRVMYRVANTGTVTVRNKDDNYREYNVSNLPLCKNCAAMIMGAPKTSNQFEAIMRAAAEKSELSQYKSDELDIFGYTKDWKQISDAYRNLQNFTCEECGVQITEPFDYQYMHVHHISGIKTDNRQQNLKCLCIECHSKVDDKHRKNFSTKAQRVQIEEFKNKYRL